MKPVEPRDGCLTARFVALCAAPGGCSNEQIAAATGAKRHTTNTLLMYLVHGGVLFKAGVGRANLYFSSESARDTWVAEELPRLLAARREVRRAQWRDHARNKRAAMPPKPPRVAPEAPPRKIPEPGLFDRLIEFCAVPDGKTTTQLVAAGLGKRDTISGYCCKLVGAGRLFKSGRRGRYTYFASEADALAFAEKHAEVIAMTTNQFREYNKRCSRVAKSEQPKVRTAKPRPAKVSAKPANRYAVVPAEPSVPATVTIKDQKSKRPAHMAGDPIITPHTKITIAKPGHDYRYAVDPSIAGNGAISRDWMERQSQGSWKSY